MIRKIMFGLLIILTFGAIEASWVKSNEIANTKPYTSFVEWGNHYSSPEDMISHSDLIIRGKMIKSSPENRSGMIFSMEDVEIIKVYKGNFNSKDIITILQTGGAGTEPFPEAPLLDKRKEYILFLEKTERVYQIMGGYQGLGKIINGNLDLNFIGDPVTDKLQDMTVENVEKLIEAHKY